jgi:hypothetical protein
MIAENLKNVRLRVEAAAQRAGRDPREVKLIAVSKTKPVSMIEECIAEGQLVFGENKVQELVEKIPQLPQDLEWHLIGHLQKNKVKYIVDQVALIHSVDTVALAEQIQKEAVKKNCDVDILLEVNVAKEETKSGFNAEEVYDACCQIAAFPNVHIKGLMTVAPFVENPEENRIIFRKLKQLYVDIQGKKVDNICMSELSMGMSNDFEVAIEEGATMVRVGTALFGARDYALKNDN